jgi:hypothetical protein
VDILTLRLAELKKIHTLDAPFSDATGRKKLHFVQEDILGGIFLLSKLLKNTKSDSAWHYVDKMKYLGCLQCGVSRTVHLSALSQQTGFLLRKPSPGIKVIYPSVKNKVLGSVFNYDAALTMVYGCTHCGLFCD